MHASVLSEEKVVMIQLFLNTDFRHIFQIPFQFSPRRLITGHKSSIFLLLLSTCVLRRFQWLKSLTRIPKEFLCHSKIQQVPSSLRQLLQSDLLRRVLHNADKISGIIQKTKLVECTWQVCLYNLDFYLFFLNSFKVP